MLCSIKTLWQSHTSVSLFLLLFCLEFSSLFFFSALELILTIKKCTHILSSGIKACAFYPQRYTNCFKGWANRLQKHMFFPSSWGKQTNCHWYQKSRKPKRWWKKRGIKNGNTNSIEHKKKKIQSTLVRLLDKLLKPFRKVKVEKVPALNFGSAPDPVFMALGSGWILYIFLTLVNANHLQY